MLQEQAGHDGPVKVFPIVVYRLGNLGLDKGQPPGSLLFGGLGDQMHLLGSQVVVFCTKDAADHLEENNIMYDVPY